MSKPTISRYNTIMMNQEEQQALSLAATTQALSIVHEVASEGKFDADYAAPVLNALVTYDPTDALSAFGGDTHKLQYGINQLKKLFNETLNRDISQYLLAVMGIELKLVKSPQMHQLLRSELQRFSQQHENRQPINQSSEGDTDDDLFDDELIITLDAQNLTNDSLISEFANLYKQTASQTEPRIMIKGNHQFLQQESSANQIRALLLAALRGAAFFRHNGGKRFDLMMKRNQYIKILNAF